MAENNALHELLKGTEHHDFGTELQTAYKLIIMLGIRLTEYEEFDMVTVTPKVILSSAAEPSRIF